MTAKKTDTTAAKDPADWVTGDEPMTGPQESYLNTLAREAGTEVPDDLTASFFVTTDKANNSVGGFYEGAMRRSDLTSWGDRAPWVRTTTPTSRASSRTSGGSPFWRKGTSAV